ncbi:MAG: glycosyltransferase, partial [Vicinamibacterales bacterium]
TGTPVVASTAASIPEVVGEAGVLVEPTDVRAWYEALVAVLGSPSRAAQMREAGVARAATFTWKRTATATREVYREVAAR